MELKVKNPKSEYKIIILIYQFLIEDKFLLENPWLFSIFN